MKFLKKFETVQAYNAAKDNLVLPNVSLISEAGGTVCTPKPHDYSKDYLTFVATESGTFKFSGSTTANTVSYSLDNGSTWTELASNTYSPTVDAGHKIMWKASGLVPYSSMGIGKFMAANQFTVEGNIMSLYYGDNFVGETDLSGKDYAFYGLFWGCYGIVNAENLVLPAMTLSNYCYQHMFYSCGRLTTSPKILPATTLENGCYNSMFKYCNKLTAAPELPATTLVSSCYYGMFQGCTSLTTAPTLHATTLASQCCQEMFQGCTSLTTAPELPATTLATQCYYNMFMSCTSLTTAPELPATTLTTQCYYQMFKECKSLNYIKCLATDRSATGCTDWWVNGVASSGTFVKASSMSSWTTGTSGIPNGWTVQTASS